jgi:hypothetical protein
VGSQDVDAPLVLFSMLALGGLRLISAVGFRHMIEFLIM